VKALFIGDSRTSGYGTDFKDLWPEIIANSDGPNVCVDAAAGATSQDMTNFQAVRLLKPQIVVANTASVNDPVNSVTLASTINHVTNFWGLNSNYCGRWYETATEPTFNATWNPAIANEAIFIMTNYPASNVIDMYDATVTPGGTTLFTNDSYDGIHFSTIGHSIKAAMVRNRIDNHIAVP
jgi:hypothetical protein